MTFDAPPPVPTRRHDLDVLRVFACYLLLLFHVGMVFNPAPFFHVRNPDSSVAFLVLCGFISLWHMPLLFLLAGWSAAVSLRTRGTRAFLRERWHKLAVPLIAGCILLAPLIKYVELRSGQDLSHQGLAVTEEVAASMRAVLPVELPRMEPFDESFAEFLPGFFTRLDRFTWSHLWFVAYLLTFTLVGLPGLARAARRPPARATPSRAWAYAPIVPLAFVQLVLRERFPGPYNLYDDWASVSYFVTYLACGLALAIVPGLEEAVRAERRRALGLGGLAAAALLASVLGVIQSKELVLAGSAVAGWCFVVSLLGFAQVHWSGPRRHLDWLVESAFPVYVLHQPVVVLIGAGVVALPLGIAAKFALLLGVSSAVTLALYAYGVRPFAPTRWLLGMKPLASGRPRPRPEPVGPGPASRATGAVGPVRAWRRAAIAALVALPVLPVAAGASGPEGLWWAEGGFAQVEIHPCGDALCGRVVWLRHPFDETGCALRDVENPDPVLRRRPVEGLEILHGLRASSDDPGEWSGGRIYDPGSGRTYSAVVETDGPDRLRVRGYLGIRLLGRTTTWVRVGTEDRCTGEG